MLIAFIVLHISSLVAADRVVFTTNGPVQGITVTSRGKLMEAFLGIPYAEPPVGRLRFRKPVPKTPWIGVHDASHLPPTCTQNATEGFYDVPALGNMTEDCLYLNIWVPHDDSAVKKLKPIIVYVHGGTFNHGSSNMALYNGANFSAAGDVLVATMNYRVGSLGFFSAFIDEAVGNIGIHDVILATKWVKANAESFGGDPNHIVLIGESAGSMIVAGFITSPIAKSLYKRIVMQSGSSLQTMILDENARLLNTGQRFAAMLGCADKTTTLKKYPREVVSCLRRLSDRQLAEAEGVLLKINPVSFFPRVGDEFLPVPPVESFKKGEFADTEVLIGVNSIEGNYFLPYIAPDYFGTYGHDNVKSFSRRLTKQILNYIYRNTEQNDTMAIAQFYIGLLSNATSDDFTRLLGMSLGDYMIVCNSYYTAEFCSTRNPVYFYYFKRRPSLSPLAEWMDVTHFDEIQYMMGNPLFGAFTPEEELFSERMMKRWIAFAKTGNPNIDGEVVWQQFTYDRPWYLELNDVETALQRVDEGRCEFWRDRYRADGGLAALLGRTNKLSAAVPSLSGHGWLLVSIMASFVVLKQLFVSP